MEFPAHGRSTYGSVIIGLLMVTAVELFPVHMLLSRWHPLIGWGVTVLSLYGVLWLLADFRATRRRAVVLTPDRLVLRAGLRWKVSIPMVDVQVLDRLGGSMQPDDGALKLTTFSDPVFQLRTVRPAVARGPYGLTKWVDRVLFTVDDPDRFLEVWRHVAPPRGAAVAGPSSKPAEPSSTRPRTES